MSTRPKLLAADLFCGAGGSSSGLVRSCERLDWDLELLAINHDRNSVNTHLCNHPKLRHLCEDLARVRPQDVIPGGYLDVLLLSPECTYFSAALGGKPMNEQSRAGAWHATDWCTQLRIEHVLLENVKEFSSWGPLYPCTCNAPEPTDPKKPKKHVKGFNCLRPIKSEKGKYFRAFVSSLQALGYTVEWKVLCAADYGAAQARHRLFLQASLSGKIAWPAQTHAPVHTINESDGLRPHRGAEEIIDWSLQSRSIFGRKKPLVPATLRRIDKGLEKFCGLPFLLGQQSGAKPRPLSQPGPTVAAAGAISLIQPYLVVLRNHADAQALNLPTPVVCAGGSHLGLVEPQLTPYIVPTNHGDGDLRSYALHEPLRTIAGNGNFALATPQIKELPKYLINMKGQSTAMDLEKPSPTVTAHAEHLYLVEPKLEPFITPYYGTGGAESVKEPLDTVTTNDRFALVTPEIAAQYHQAGHTVLVLDILFRMLEPHELAGAQGFDSTYQFLGTKKQRRRMIGNAVEVNQAAALTGTILSHCLPKTQRVPAGAAL